MYLMRKKMEVNKITSNLAKLYLVDAMGYKKPQMPTEKRPYCIFFLSYHLMYFTLQR